jgi:hypothetical protein
MTRIRFNNGTTAASQSAEENSGFLPGDIVPAL